MTASQLMVMVLKEFNIIKHMVCSRWPIYQTLETSNLFIWEILGDKVTVSGLAHSQMKMKPGMITKGWKNVFNILSSLMGIGGCVLKTGKLITTEFMYVKYFRVLGTNFPFLVNGRETLRVVVTLVSTKN